MRPSRNIMEYYAAEIRSSYTLRLCVHKIFTTNIYEPTLSCGETRDNMSVGKKKEKKDSLFTYIVGDNTSNSTFSKQHSNATSYFLFLFISLFDPLHPTSSLESRLFFFKYDNVSVKIKIILSYHNSSQKFSL